MIFRKSKQRVLALLENLTQLFEAVDIIPVEIHQHLFSAKHNTFIKSLFTIILSCYIDSQEWRVNIIISFSKQS